MKSNILLNRFYSIEKRIAKSILFLVAMLLCFANLWAQPTPSTTSKIYPFRFHNNMNSGSYYVVPTATTEDSKVKTSTDNVTGRNYYWYVVKNSDNTYSFIHLMSGFYLNYPSALCTTYNDDNRKNVSLSSTLSKYSITANNGHFYIAPSCQISYHMEPNGGNGNNLNFYNVDNRNEARWDFVDGQEIEFQNLMSDFSINGDDVIDAPGTTQYTHTNSLYSGYFQFEFNSTTYYKTSLTAGATTTLPSGSTDGVTYSWSLEGINNSYATISNDGKISYLDYVPTDQTATIKLTATHGETTRTVSKQVTFKAPEVDPTDVSATNMTVYVGKSQNAAVTLTPNPCYRHLEFTSANIGIATVNTTTGVVTGVSLGNTTVTVNAYKVGNTEYISTSFNVVVKDKVADPVITFTPSGTAGATASITCSTTDAQIYYTIDGSTPTTSSTLYESTFNVEDGATVKAMAVKEGELWDNSNVVSKTYHDIFLATPEISIVNGSVTFSSTDEGVSFYYTTNGSAPTTSSTLWNGSPITSGITNEATIKVIAVRTGARNSAVASRQYIQASGVSGTTVTINDYEDHNWSYYKGLDYTLEDGTTTYNDKYKYSLYSPDPRNVKITYRGYNTTGNTIILNNTATAISSLNTNTSPRVSASETQNTFVYYETLEKFVIGFFTQAKTGDDYNGSPANPNNPAEQYPYTVISNPFSVRPSTGTTKTYYGFAGWKIISGGEHILEYNDGQVIPLDAIIHFTGMTEGYTANCTSAEVVFEATWTQANVKTGTSAQSFDGGTYETNFIVASGDIGDITQYSPCTISAFYPDGTAYDTYSSTRTISGLAVSTSGSEPKNNTVKVEWIRHGNGTFNANGKNMILGRGITSGSSQGTIYCINSNNPCVNIVKIESGNYGTMTPINTDISATNAVNTYISFGCDYDKARANYYSTATNAYNTKLQINNITWSRMGKANRSHGDLYIRTLFKSGKFSGDYYAHTASTQGQRFVTIKGGYFTGNITCGSEVDYNQDNARAVTLHIRGSARVDGRIAGGSTQRNCSGDRSIVITGGRIGGWIAAGSNSNSTSGGITQGETFVYIGGNAEVNSHQFNADGTEFYNASTGGVVYGSGCGINHDSESGGVTKGSSVVLADNAYVERGIYGGGAMGKISSGKPSHIFIFGGKVGTGAGQIQEKDEDGHVTGILDVDAGVFGGACNVGGGYSYIYMNGGVVESGIYGGSNLNGSMDNDANVKIVGGQVGYSDAKANVHGGGYGSDTRVLGSVNVTIGNSGATTGATIYGDVYGGSAEGKTNGNTARTTDAVTNVTLNAGTINGNLYGGGLGTSTNAADVWGPVQVTMNGGEVNNVFGCNNNNGAPKSSVNVKMTGGEVHECVYGGGNAAAYNAGSLTDSPQVEMTGGTVDQSVFGGGLGSTAIITGSTRVIITGTSHVKQNVYGGGNGGLVTGNTHVDIK